MCEEKEKLIVPRKERVCSRTLSACLEFSHRASKTRRCFFLKNSALDIFRLNFLPAKLQKGQAALFFCPPLLSCCKSCCFSLLTWAHARERERRPRNDYVHPRVALFIRLPRRRIRDEHVHLSLPDRFTKRLHEPSRYGQSNRQLWNRKFCST